MIARAPISVATTPTDSRRGACPTLDAPMQTGDGLLARIRVAGRRLTPAQLSRIARLAEQHGNGLVEVTARGNLQARGLTPASAPAFASAVSTLVDVDTGLVIDMSPIAGADPQELADPTPLALAIREGALPIQDRLGPKVAVVIDGVGQVSMTALKADVRLVALSAQMWSITLGGGKPQTSDADGAVAAALAMLGALAAMGPEARAIDLFPGHHSSGVPHPPPSVRTGGWRGDDYVLRQGITTSIALPFGSARSVALVALADLAHEAGVTTLRLGIDHAVLVDNAPHALIARAAELGFVTEPEDPRRRVSACIGSPGCAAGHFAARHMAEELADRVPRGQHLHVSGCAKGCAHPRRAEVTLVGRADGIGLVIDGRAGDTPVRILDRTHLADALVPYPGGR